MTSESTRSRRAPLTLRKKLLFTLLVTIFCLALAEGAGRILGYPTGELQSPSKLAIRDPDVLARTVGIWRPGYRGRLYWPRELAFDIAINDLGLRGPEIALEPDERLRILCLGDSTTFGIYVEEAETWPRQLEQRLREDGQGVEVINGGGPGWSTADQYRFLSERASRLRPGLVIHLFCGNDPNHIRDPAGQQGRFARQLRRAREPRFANGVREFLRSSTALGEMTTRLQSLLTRGTGSRTEGPRGNGNDGEPLDPIAEESWKKYEECYGLLAEWCRDQGIPLITACFPHHPTDNPRAVDFDALVGAVAERAGVPFIPINAEFGAATDFDQLYNLPLDLHASAAGNARLAELIARALRDRGHGPYGR